MKRILKILLLSPIFIIGGFMLLLGYIGLVCGEWILSKIGAM
jgi:hypothetical protein